MPPIVFNDNNNKKHFNQFKSAGIYRLTNFTETERNDRLATRFILKCTILKTFEFYIYYMNEVKNRHRIIINMKKGIAVTIYVH